MHFRVEWTRGLEKWSDFACGHIHSGGINACLSFPSKCYQRDVFMCRNMGEFSYMQKDKIVKGKRLSHWVTYRLIHEKWMYRQDLWLQSDVGHWTLSGSWERKLASWIVPVTHYILLERCSGDQIRKDNVCRFEIKVDSVYFGGKIQVNFFWIFSQNALINSM